MRRFSFNVKLLLLILDIVSRADSSMSWEGKNFLLDTSLSFPRKLCSVKVLFSMSLVRLQGKLFRSLSPISVHVRIPLGLRSTNYAQAILRLMSISNNSQGNLKIYSLSWCGPFSRRGRVILRFLLVCLLGFNQYSYIRSFFPVM